MISDTPEPLQIDPLYPGGPAIPTPYTASHDCNPICGCHLGAKCSGCGVCTACDDCYCGED